MTTLKNVMAVFVTFTDSDGLVYVAVAPCRIADTRGKGHISADTSRSFRASGDAAIIAGQGGNPAGCPNPKGATKPLAINAYVIATPPGPGATSGVLSAYPAGQPVPPVGSGSTVNFDAQDTIGNTTTITLCDPGGACPSGDFTILSRNTNQHVVVDVQGYFYPAAVGSGGCPADMAAAGSLCIDKYEASVWSAATGGTQFGVASDDYPCKDSGGDCAAGEAFPIYARSEAGVTPSTSITWYQAQQACANSGKRLPTTTEWQMAASGTQSGTAVCNFSGAVMNTGALPSCISTSGALDMIGNVWEWGAEMDAGSIGTTDTNNEIARAFGDGFANTGNASTRALWVLDGTGAAGTGPQRITTRLGLRCVR